MMGWQALFYKEVLRFWKVSAQTIAAPVLTALLYMLIFGHLLEGRVTVYDSVSYTAFLVPGLVMMSLLQNAFANSSSSMVQSKMMGNLVFILLTPLGPLSWFTAYVLAAVVRGLVVGLGVLLVTMWFAPISFVAPLWILVFALMGAAMLGTLGLIAGLWADKFDQMSSFQNFLITPMTFLSGVFYSIHSLPPFWQQARAVRLGMQRTKCPIRWTTAWDFWPCSTKHFWQPRPRPVRLHCRVGTTRCTRTW